MSTKTIRPRPRTLATIAVSTLAPILVGAALSLPAAASATSDTGTNVATTSAPAVTAMGPSQTGSTDGENQGDDRLDPKQEDANTDGHYYFN